MEVFLIFPKSKQAQQELGQELAKFQSEQALKSIQKLPCSGTSRRRREASESAAIIHSKRADQPQQPVCSFTAMVMSV